MYKLYEAAVCTGRGISIDIFSTGGFTGLATRRMVVSQPLGSLWIVCLFLFFYFDRVIACVEYSSEWLEKSNRSIGYKSLTASGNKKI
jgi:hypothetical protein